MEVRRRTTLLDQMALIHSANNLRDLLRLRDEEDRRQERTLTTLGSVLFGDKQDHPLPLLSCSRNSEQQQQKKEISSSSAAAAAVSRTLLDIMREEESVVAEVATDMEFSSSSVASSSGAGGSNNSKMSWKSFKDRLGLRRISGSMDQTSNILPAVSEDPTTSTTSTAPATAAEENSAPTSVAATASEPVHMDLASALAAERRLRPGVIVEVRPVTPARMSLMTLLEETDRPAAGVEGGEGEAEMEKKVGDGGVGDFVCCVCMVRKKGAAFIPCGHTFCRVCSRELWVGRGDCPLCNARILEILDIF